MDKCLRGKNYKVQRGYSLEDDRGLCLSLFSSPRSVIWKAEGVCVRTRERQEERTIEKGIHFFYVRRRAVPDILEAAKSQSSTWD